MSESGRAIRFPPRLILASPIHTIAFGFGTGLAPVAPGTFGTIPGVLLFLALSWLHVQAFALALLILALLGWAVCAYSSRKLGVHDHPGIVVDEMVGYCVAAAPLLPALGWMDAPLWLGLLVAFVSFRFFDILKPWPIRWLDQHVGGGLGIMVDDLLAGVFAAAVTGALTLLLGEALVPA
ncbi:MAG: phosphatidylglycerophosphatase A [Algiphilus sp.]|uniref:phosphatidylglycerophosphatase A family protein n=1 Tax=Algiphilus sp. TaxID=1872431 RepID=UPI0032EFCDDF